MKIKNTSQSLLKTIFYSITVLAFLFTINISAKKKDKKAPNIKLKSFSTQYSGKDAWKYWNIKTSNGNASLKTQYSGDNAWKSWSLRLANGKSLRVSTQYSGKDAWKSWRINDNLKAPLKLKISALIAIIYSGAVRNSPSKALAKSTCMLKGKKLYGKVKIVKYNPTFKVKTVTYSQNLKVKKVKYSANSCGKWEFVKYGEDFSVQFVDYGEDLKIKYVDYGEGM